MIEDIHARGIPGNRAMKDLVPPVEVSRVLLLLLVAAGALVSVASQGQLSSFAGGFAAGAGSAFVFSWAKRTRGEAPEDENG